MKVRIIDPEHPYSDKTGVLITERKINGRELSIDLDDSERRVGVKKHQIEVVGAAKVKREGAAHRCVCPMCQYHREVDALHNVIIN
jgi:hypothetical protein